MLQQFTLTKWAQRKPSLEIREPKKEKDIKGGGGVFTLHLYKDTLQNFAGFLMFFPYNTKINWDNEIRNDY